MSDADIDALRRQARDCTRCDLYRAATQTVFGEGGAAAEVMPVVATIHPSSILRAPDDETREIETARFIDDLRLVARTFQD